jgi:phenylalanyl-tRNA synthetase beta chain
MKVSLQWLSDYVDVSGYTARELAEKLTRGGIEVDVVEERNQGVSGVVVGYVKTREKHPDADKLSVCTVDVGQGDDLQIVCGAPNVAAGQKVPVAVVGAVLPGDFKIKKAKLRGVESQGMICSAKELGLNDKLLPKEIQEGILVLPADITIGESILDVLALNDQVLELDLTPNRSDALSMRGAAYELGALLGKTVKLPVPDVAKYELGLTSAADLFQISIRSAVDCSHYAGRVIEGVQVAPSPLWLQNRLMAAGIRPINNIVDITNYVLLEYGQPLHAFDADCLAGGRIEVRTAQAGESFVSLDGAERKLAPHMLLITDGEKPVALAGVMGGANSEVTEATTRIFLESAKFAGGSVRKTSRQLGLRSEASLRFEKEVDAAAVIAALDRAAVLIAELAGGQIAKGITEASTSTVEEQRVSLGLERLNRYLGTDLSQAEVSAIFDRLAFDYEYAMDSFNVIVPTRRGDITRDVDLIEEVARLYGYDNIPTTLLHGSTTPGALTKPQFIRRAVRRLLTQSGLHEAVSYSFTQPSYVGAFSRFDSGLKPIRLAMPMSEDRSVLRTSLVPHMLDMATYNRNRSKDDLALFEVGSVFIHAQDELTELPTEKHRLAILITGGRHGVSWTGAAQPVDFFDLKGIVEKLCSHLGLSVLRWKAAELDDLHPGRTADIYAGDVLLGYAGQLHPTVQADRDLADTYVAELDLAAVYELADFDVDYRVLPRYPSITRDIAVVVDQSVHAGNLSEQVREIAGTLLESVQIFDIYVGERLGAGKKSVALALVYRHTERTLTDEEVTELHERVVASLAEQFGAELRK